MPNARRLNRLTLIGSLLAPCLLALAIPFIVLRGLALPRALVFNTSLRADMIWQAAPALIAPDVLVAGILALVLLPLAMMARSQRRGIRITAVIFQTIVLTTAVLLLAIQYRVWREVGFYPNLSAIRRFAGPGSPFLQSARSFTDIATVVELSFVLIAPPAIFFVTRRFNRAAFWIAAFAIVVALISPLLNVDPPARALATHPYLQLFRPTAAAPDPRDPDISDDPPSLNSIAQSNPPAICYAPLGQMQDRSIMLVVLESTGDQYLFTNGHSKFPQLERIAHHAVRFPRYYAPSGTSNPAMFTILTSRHAVPAEEWWDTPRDRAAEALPALLAARGYRSAFFLSGCFRYFFDEPLFRGMGWTVCRDGDDMAKQFYIPTAQRDPSGHCIDDAVSLRETIAFVDGYLKTGTPSFTVLYTGIPHMPYDFLADSPHAVHHGESLSAFQRYENQIAYVDALIGRLYDHLVERRFFDNGLLVITADHGEAFGQHSENFVHGAHLFDENVRVPLLIVHPSINAVDCLTPASHVNLAPTILDLAAIDPPPRMDGRSIFMPDRHGMIFLSAAHNQLKLGVVDWPYKAIHLLAANQTLLFNLVDDPAESNDLSTSNPELTARYRTWIKSFRYHYLTPDRLKNLPPAEQLYWNGRQALATGASPSLAADDFRKALAIRPDYDDARLQLADCFYRLGEHCLRSKRMDDARAQFTEALRLDPNHAAARAALEALGG